MIKSSDMPPFLFKTLDPTWKGVVFSNYRQTLHLNNVYRKNFTFTILDEALVMNQIVFYFSKNFYLVDEINKILSKFRASGLITYWMSKYQNAGKAGKRKFQTSFKITNLVGIFEMLIFGLTLSFLSFVVELSTECFKKSFIEILRKKPSWKRASLSD